MYRLCTHIHVHVQYFCTCTGVHTCTHHQCVFVSEYWLCRPPCPQNHCNCSTAPAATSGVLCGAGIGGTRVEYGMWREGGRSKGRKEGEKEGIRKRRREGERWSVCECPCYCSLLTEPFLPLSLASVWSVEYISSTHTVMVCLIWSWFDRRCHSNAVVCRWLEGSSIHEDTLQNRTTITVSGACE